ncbi:MAG: D-aminoacyl-tRNA deacylase [Gammaproteobacteria bacterium]|nr:D-aminoacyl-tRNA deacylase [Gammaproteobacteria bacterium]MCI0591429.1 D-aminoacyl-tRNA deacylase [Gammaproteobacteria bacterium]
MIGLLQRVTHASVDINGETVGAIDAGLLVLLGIEKGDGERQADRLLERLLRYRVFSDQDGKMNRSLKDIDGGLLLVPQFTLPADTKKGMRPSLTPAAEPKHGARLFDYIVQCARAQHAKVACGRFGAHMQVTLTNDGPATFWLRVTPAESDPNA